MKKDSLKEIAEVIKKAQSIMLFPHENPDGDALGSCSALCRCLRNMGKTAWILTDDDVPANLNFLGEGMRTLDENIIEEPDLCICVDCGDPGRIEKRYEKFRAGRKTICIDHHMSSGFFCDYNYIDPEEAATGQIIFDLLRELEHKPDKETGEDIFAAVTTDTGDFQYSNTQKKSHLIAAELYDWGVDFNKVSVEIYENVRPEKIMLKNCAMATLKLMGGGKGAMVSVTQEMLEKTGASMDESEGLAQDLRSISGVEYSAVLKEYEEKKIKVSLRAKRLGNVATMAEALGGGGHIKAAGCTLKMPIRQAEETIEKALSSAIKELEQK